MKTRLYTLLVMMAVSSASCVFAQTFTVSLKAFLEGPFNGSEMNTSLNNMNFLPLTQPYNVPPWNYQGTESVAAIPNADVVDWVLVEVRETAGDATTAYKDNTIAAQAGFILKNGNIVALDGMSPLQFNYAAAYKLYSVVYHRNHLAVMSGNELVNIGGDYSYDFTTGADQAQGGANAHKEIATGVWGMVSGDGNADGQVNNADKIGVWVVQGGFSGYRAGDYNLDGQVSNPDKVEKWSVNTGRSSQVTGSWYCNLPVEDNRDGQFYQTKQIGTQCWMAENLNIGTMITGTSNQTNNGVLDKYCYDDNAASCDTYGGLYQWSEMMQYETTPGVKGICPDGWHLPTDGEYCTMTQLIDQTVDCGIFGWSGTDAGTKMKSTTGWYGGGNGTNASGFTALPGGERIANGIFYDLTKYGIFWSSSENPPYAWGRSLNYNLATILRCYDDTGNGYSVRCVKNEGNQPPALPSNPNPPNNSTNQPLNTQLSWTCIDPENDPLTFDICFGSTNPPPLVALGNSGTTYDPGNLYYGMTYYWNIVAHDDHGNTTEGPVWSFTTIANLPPFQPSSPNPPESATNQPIDVQISWTCTDPEGDWLSYDVYLGTTNPPPQVIAGITANFINTNNLTAMTLYYWKVIAHDDHSNATEGPVWSFTTGTQATWHCGDLFTDPRDNQTYPTVFIGDQCWMAKNMNIGTMVLAWFNQHNNGIIEKYCYADEPDKCDIWGGLYDWSEAIQYNYQPGSQGICPDGWHVPTHEEWISLANHSGNSSGPLKEIGYTHWNSPNTGATNLTGFTAFGGGRQYGSGYSSLANSGYFWSSTGGGSNIWYVVLYYNNTQLYQTNTNPYYAFSVRCMKSLPNQSPLEPSIPNPSQNSTNIPINTPLSWGCTDPESDPLTYDVYLGSSYPPPQVATGLAVNVYNPDTLNPLTAYYWRIIAHDDHGNTTIGPGWTFTTGTQMYVWHCDDSLVDSRDGKWYQTKKIGTQCWMTENLNIGNMMQGSGIPANNGIVEKYCYGNSPSFCNIYGGLYNWNEMMQYVTTPGTIGICPPTGGWHVPTDDEYCILTQFIDPTVNCNSTSWSGTNVGTKMKSTLWGGTNTSGFTALPGGVRNTNGDFLNIGANAYFWTSAESGSNSWHRGLSSTSTRVFRNNSDKNMGYSVRCLKYDSNPTVPSNPDPPNNSLIQLINIELSWSCTDPDNDPLTFDVYFGTINPPPLFTTGVIDTTYNPGTLSYNTTYYWKIVAYDDHGNSTPGPVWTFSISSPWQCGAFYIDHRDYQQYNTVQIGTQCWMAENLNIGSMIQGSSSQTNNGVIEKYCYYNTPSNCDIYGGLYQWDEMMQYMTTPGVKGICPDGWHLPTDNEWCALTLYLDATVDCSSAGWSGTDVGTKMKSTSGWYGGGNGTNSSGFTALPGGRHSTGGSGFVFLTYLAYFYSSTEGGDVAWYRELSHGDPKIGRNSGLTKACGLSVRCIRD